jgi:alpha-L-rhamnosidase
MNEYLDNLTVDFMNQPLGIDSHCPVFGWQLIGDRRGLSQSAYQIVVEQTGENPLTVWDSEIQQSAQSQDIYYDGIALTPCTAYKWILTVWNENRNTLPPAAAVFETGLMDSSETAWNGAMWIGSPELELNADALGIFRIETKFRIAEGGSSAGLVFGADDGRLKASHRNISGLAGENYISYEIDVSNIPARLIIHRVGYANEDISPFAVMDIVEFNNPHNMPVTKENRHDFHTLAVEVYGNHAIAFVDGVCIDAIEEMSYFPTERMIRRGRQLNPLAINDCPTFPRLCKLGFTAARETSAQFYFLRVSNIRTPRAVVFESGFFEIKGKDARVLLYKNPSHGAAPILRRTFTVKKGLRSARLYVACRGIYEGLVNNEKISDAWFQPDASQFDRHLYYKTYDITDLLKSGENTLDFQLASGWWSDAQTYALMNYNYFGDRPSLLAKLTLTYADKTKKTIVTEPQSWHYRMDGAVKYASFFQGQVYDARAENSASDNWKNAVEIIPVPQEETAHGWPVPNYAQPKIISHIGNPVREVCRLTAVSRDEVRPGVYIYDMGQNLAGVPNVKLKGKTGDKILLRFGEMRYPASEEYAGLGGLLLTENLRDAENNDTYICKGDPDGEWFMPRFTYHGYRYVEINGVTDPPEISEVEAVVLSSTGKITGGFECSNEAVNKLYENILWSQRANFISIPTDCPQRNERMGWMGDAHVFARTACYNADMRLLFYRYLTAAKDLQQENGRYPNIAPVGGGFGAIAWECAGIVIPYELYKHYGDIGVIRENYTAMKRYLSYINANTRDGLLLPGVGLLGDWLATEKGTDDALVFNAIAAYIHKITAEMADAIGDTVFAKKLRKDFEILCNAWSKNFIDGESGKTKAGNGIINDTQCSYCLPLAFALLNKEAAQKAAHHLNRKTIELGYTLTTGFLGTGIICEVLTLHGFYDTAYRLLQQKEFPSWLYSVTQGATTIWERWNSYTIENGFGGNNNMNSFNHYSLGAVGAWLYGHILGIRPLKAGYKHFLLEPCIASLEYAKGHYDSPYGRIESGWERNGNQIKYFALVPPNTEATLRISGVNIRLPSGTYHGLFEIPNKK